MTSKEAPVPDAAPLGMALFLASLAVLFASSLAGYFYVRLIAEQWPPPGAPPLPATLWASTGVLVASSFTVHHALRGAQAGNQGRLRGGLALTFLLALVFLGLQVLNWWELTRGGLTVTSDLYGWTFYVLTALHALHLLGGLIPLGVTSARAWGGRYGAEEHMGVRLCAMYWHFLDGVWLVLFATLYLVG